MHRLHQIFAVTLASLAGVTLATVTVSHPALATPWLRAQETGSRDVTPGSSRFARPRQQESQPASAEDQVLLHAPTDLVASTAGHDRIELRWTDLAEGETGYQVERSQDGFSFSTIARLVADSESFSDQSLAAATSYTYQVRVYQGDQQSAPSNPAWAITDVAPAPAAPDDPSGLVYGINALWEPNATATMRERFRKAHTLGVTQVRMDWEWRWVEPEPGSYVWTQLDDLVQLAYAEGIELLPIVHYAPEWALRPEDKPDGTYQMAPAAAHFDDYARFLAAAIGRYGPQGNAPFDFTPIRYWQVYNEPNTPQFWGPAPDPAAFTELMQAVAAAVADRPETVQIVHAGLAKADLTFLWQLWQADPDYGATFDILAVHPYLYDWNEGIRAPDAMDADEPDYAALGFIGSPTDPGFLAKVFNLQLLMTLYGHPDKPIWITEMGYFVGDPWLGVSETEQAERLILTLDFIRDHLTTAPFGAAPRDLPANVQRVYWFALEDYEAPDGMGSFGLFRPDGSRRPAADAFTSH